MSSTDESTSDTTSTSPRPTWKNFLATPPARRPPQSTWTRSDGAIGIPTAAATSTSSSTCPRSPPCSAPSPAGKSPRPPLSSVTTRTAPRSPTPSTASPRGSAPTHSWQATWIAEFCTGSAARADDAHQWCPSLRCRSCSTDFTSALETRADGTRCLVLTTWKILGEDRRPDSREWMSHRQLAHEGYTGFSWRGGPLREGGRIRAALVGHLESGKALDLRGRWVAEDKFAPPGTVERHVEFLETDRVRRHRRGIAEGDEGGGEGDAGAVVAMYDV